MFGNVEDGAVFFVNLDSQLKYVLLVTLLLGVIPLARWLRASPHNVRKIAVVVGFLPFGVTAIPHANMAIISWAFWPGFAKGIEVSILDMVLLALFLVLPKSRSSLPFRVAMGFYFATVVISVLWSSVPIASFFYVWQLLRMFFVYVVVARACRSYEVVQAILTGMALGIVYEAGTVFWQRFGLGLLQTPGTMGHQNGLGMVTYFAMFPLFAMYLAGMKGWQTLAAPVAGGVIAILTVSRATLALASFGFAAIFLLSALRMFTSRKAIIAAVGLILILASIPIVMSSFEKRFAEAPLSGAYDERAAFENAAIMMLSDHPMGVGPNQFVVVANSDGYYDRAGVAAVLGSRSAHVHNAFLLAAAETGYLGAFAFILVLAPPLITAFRVGWRNRGDRRGDLLLGLAVAFFAVYVQSFFEWAFFNYWFQYMFVVSVGLTAGLLEQLRHSTPAKDRSATVKTSAFKSQPVDTSNLRLTNRITTMPH